MKILLSDRTGFCFGVKRAVGMAEEALKKNAKLCSLGSVIHNAQVVDDLSKKGLRVVRSIGGVRQGAVLISSHGISPVMAGRIAARGLKIIDTTCPFVLNAQKCARQLGGRGRLVIIVGDADHPEVKALVDFVRGRVAVVRNRGEAADVRLPRDAKVGILSQTTQSTANFLETVKAILEKKPKELHVVNTICNDAEERQRLARELAHKVDLMLIIGGRNSANTRRLLDVCKKVQKNTRLVETDRELRKAWFNNRVRVVGIASGASTPDRAVQQVVQKIHRKGVA